MIKSLYENNKNIDIRVTEPNWSEKDQNYKTVQYWNKKEKYLGQPIDPTKQYIIIPGNGIVELDHDFTKYLNISESLRLLNYYQNTKATFGRSGNGHSIYKLKNSPSKQHPLKRIYLGDRVINEYRPHNCYSIIHGKLDKSASAYVKGDQITEIDHDLLIQQFYMVSAIAALTIIGPKKNTMNDFILAVSSECFNNNLKQNVTEELIEKWLYVIDREDRVKESIKTIIGVYKKEYKTGINSPKFSIADTKTRNHLILILKSLIQKDETSKKVKKASPDAWKNGVTAREIISREYKQTEAIIDGFLFKGLNIFAGPSKIGKSNLATEISDAVENGKEIFGQKAKTGEVLFYSLEDPGFRQKKKFEKMGISPQKTLYQFKDRVPPIPKLTLGLEQEIEDWVINTPNAKLVIIDVYGKVKCAKTGNLNAYEVDNENLQDLQTISNKLDIGILLIHHTKKIKENDVFDEINGSAAIQSNADNLIVLQSQRKVGQESTLHVLPKDSEQLEWQVILNKENIRWELVTKDKSKSITLLHHHILKNLETLYSYGNQNGKEQSVKRAELIKAVIKDDELNAKSSISGKPHSKETIGKAIDRLIEKKQILVNAKAMYSPIPV